ncbi:hypothetical protein RhiirB3_457845 [Rhizophagus irregularis]|nr:hypothetical protein RhiirB3_457845 [Rhizophagus irregularis]
MVFMHDIGGNHANLTKLAKLALKLAITILDNKQTHKPSFHCFYNGKDSGIQQSTSTAINNTYKQVFRKNKTEYSEMVVMGFDDEIITNELLSDILFIPIFIRMDRILIVVSQIGISSHKGYYGAGLGFLSTLITKYKGKQSLFIQSIEDNSNYQFQEKELGAWRAIFRASGCINITPFTKKQHIIEFWTKAPDLLSDRDNLANLFKSGMLLLVEKKSSFQLNSEGKIL